MPPELTAIIVNHDTRDDLVACLESISAGAGTLRTQQVVVDNASTDGSADAVAAAFPDVELVRSERNDGFAAACNRGVARARAPFVALLNADIVCAPGALAELVRATSARAEVAVIGPRLENSDGSLQTSAYRFPTLGVECASILGLRRLVPVRALARWRWARAVLPATGHLDPHERSRAVDFVIGACMVVRRVALDQVGGFDEGYFLYYEEIDLCRRLRAGGWEVEHFPAARVVHRLGRATAACPARAYRARQASRLRYHRAHSGRFAFMTLRAVLALRSALGWLHRTIAPAEQGGVGARDHRAVLQWCLVATPPDAPSRAEDR